MNQVNVLKIFCNLAEIVSQKKNRYTRAKSQLHSNSRILAGAGHCEVLGVTSHIGPIV